MFKLRWQSALPFAIAALTALPLCTIVLALLSPNDAAWSHLAATTLPDYLSNTLWLMLLTAAFAALLGVPTAWLTAVTDFPGRRLFSWMLVLPLAAPSYIIAYLYTDLLDFSGPLQSITRRVFGLAETQSVFPNIRTIPCAALLLALVLYPYIYLIARSAFQMQTATQFQAARTLGKSAYGAFFSVALPSARPAIVGGVALVLMETLADFGVADYFAIPTFSTGIFRTWLLLGEKTAALKLAAVMLLAVAVLVFLESANRKGRRYSASSLVQPINRIVLTRRQGYVAWLMCAAPTTFGFIIPVGALLIYATKTGDQMGWANLLTYAASSAQVAIAAGVLATLAAFLLSYTERTSQTAVTKGAIRFATLGYALPGALLAIGLLSPLGAFDRKATAVAVRAFEWQGGLILTGTTAVLVYAYLVRFLTVSYNTINAGYSGISANADAAARTLGAGPLAVMVRVHFPLLRPAFVAAGVLVFVDVMRELPVTLILRPFNFETLATRVYRLASDERLMEASSAALAIVLIGLVPVLLLNRAGDQHH
ncbi:MAG: iron ABC transporter permease [Pseudomonadota bacterium]